MKVLPLIIHPHHIDFFENLHDELNRRHHDVFCLARDDRINREYLKDSDLKYGFYGSDREGYLPEFVYKRGNQFSLARKLFTLKPDLIFSVNSIPSSPFNSILNIDTIVFLDRKLRKNIENAIFNYADKIVTPDCYPFDVPPDKHITHPSYHSFAYLHPTKFEPRPEILDSSDLESKGYVFVSFARKSWEGFTDEDILTRREKMDIVRDMSEHREVVVDGRGSVPEPLEEYVPSIPLKRYNHLLANAELVLGDDPIICSEAGVLGIPWIFVSDTSTPTLEEQEIKYEIGSQVESVEEADELAEMILTEEIQPDFDRSRREIFNDKIDLTEWMIKFTEVYCKTLK